MELSWFSAILYEFYIWSFPSSIAPLHLSYLPASVANIWFWVEFWPYCIWISRDLFIDPMWFTEVQMSGVRVFGGSLHCKIHIGKFRPAILQLSFGHYNFSLRMEKFSNLSLVKKNNKLIKGMSEYISRVTKLPTDRLSFKFILLKYQELILKIVLVSLSPWGEIR